MDLNLLPPDWGLLAKMLARRPLEQRGAALDRWFHGQGPEQAERIRNALEEAERRGLHLQAQPGPLQAVVGHPTDDEGPIAIRPWPEPAAPDVYYGPVGEFVQGVAPETEADPLAVLVHVLLMFGNASGRSAYVQVESTQHHVNEFALIVGESALARKGTARDIAVAIMARADPEWVKKNIKAGLSTGEGIISAVREPVWGMEPVREKGRITGYQDVLKDEGVDDKRLLVLESEFGGVLRVLEREGNRLSPIVRCAWDGGNLSSLTKVALRAIGAHISIIGHITFDELNIYLKNIEIFNGFINRFLLFAVRRTGSLPLGGQVIDFDPIGRALHDALAFAREAGRMHFTPDARDLWVSEYDRLNETAPGVLGNVTSRAAPHVLRLALIHALIDRSPSIGVAHLRAGLALWDASSRAAEFIFGDSLGNADAEKILAALRAVRPGGMLKTQITNDVFGGKVKAIRLDAALALLLRHGRIRQEVDRETGGRPGTWFYACLLGGERGEGGNKPAAGGTLTPLSPSSTSHAIREATP
jgi:hypothetical protein